MGLRPTLTSQLRRRRSNDSHHRRRVYDGSADTEALGRIRLVLPSASSSLQHLHGAKLWLQRPTHLLHGQYRMLAPKPYALDVDALRQVPDPLFRLVRAAIRGVHDPRVVELYLARHGASSVTWTDQHVKAAPLVHGRGDHGLYVALLRYVTLDADGFARGVLGAQGVGCARDGRVVYIGQDDLGALGCELDARLETDTAGRELRSLAGGQTGDRQLQPL